MATVPPSPFSPLDVRSLLLRHCGPLTHHCFSDLTDGHAVAGAADGRALRADGRDLQLLVVSPSFAGAAPLERQRRVHAAFAPLLASGVVHSVQIRCWTPAQWEKLGRPADLGRPCALAATHDENPSPSTFTTSSSSSTSIPSSSTSISSSSTSIPPSSTSISSSSTSIPPSSTSIPPSSTSIPPSSTAARYSLPSCTEIPTEGPTAEMVLQHLLHKRPADAVACARAILSCAAAAAAARTAAEQLLARQ